MSCPSNFLALIYKYNISRFGERFRDAQLYCIVRFLFAVFLLTVSRQCQPFVKVGARASHRAL